MSNKDARKGMLGNRFFYSMKDAGMSYRNDPLPSNPLIKMTDVDYHIDDLPSQLQDWGCPVALYTIVPTVAANGEGETTFYFDEDQKITCEVSGGGRYHHQLWDYEHDTLCVSNFWGSTVFAVEKRSVSNFQALVLLIPIRRYGMMSSAVMHLTGRLHDSMKRLQPVKKFGDDHFTIIRNQKHLESNISIARAGGIRTTAATVSNGTYDRARAMMKTASSKVTTASILGLLPRPKDDAEVLKNKERAILLLEFMQRSEDLVIPRVVSPEHADQTYSQVDDIEHLNGTPPKSLVTFMSPLDPRAFSAAKTTANLKWGMEERFVRQINERINAPEPSVKLRQYVRETVTRMVGDTKLHPEDPQSILESQTGNQRIMRFKAELEQMSQTYNIDPFQKAEAYSGIKDVRVICAVGQYQKLIGSVLTHAATKWAKEQEWYCAVKPTEIAERMALAAMFGTYALATDVIRYDGSVTKPLREDVDLLLLELMFGDYIKEVNDYLESVQCQRIVIKDLLRDILLSLNSWHMTLTGEAGTGFFHSCRTIALLKTAPRLLGLTAEESTTFVKSVGLGDDATTFVAGTADPRLADPEKVVEKLVVLAKAYHLGLTIEIVPYGYPVPFLSRVFNPWTGDKNSMADVKRWMMKLHSTGHVPLVPLEKLWAKCMAILATDANTPILGEFARYAITFSSPTTKDIKSVVSWWSQFDRKDQFPNEHCEWMDTYVSETYPEFHQTIMQQEITNKTNPLEFPVCVDVPDLVNKTNRDAVIGIDATPVDDNKTSKDGQAASKVKDKHGKSDAGKVPGSGGPSDARNVPATPSPGKDDVVRSTGGNPRGTGKAGKRGDQHGKDHKTVSVSKTKKK